MFAGHIGAALALGRAERRMNVGVLIAAALLLDLLLWTFVLVGWESVSIPADFATKHQPDFVFPWTHGLLASLAWSLLAGAAAFAAYGSLREARGRAAAVVAAAVFSHWILDALVHKPELPIAVSGPAVGLGLWNAMPIALGVESALVLAGLWLYLRDSRTSPGRSIGLGFLAIFTLVFTIAGMTKAPAPPSVAAMASSSLVTLGILCVLFAWLGRAPRALKA